jgi:predicted metalloendopeptidase
MDTEKLDSLKSTLLLKDIESFGHWPILHPEKWQKNEFDLAEMMINLVQSRALDVFVDVYVSQDQRNVTRRLLHFDQSGLGLGNTAREYYLNETKYAKQLNAYEKLMNARISLLAEDSGSTRSKEEIAADVSEILAFEKKLAKIMVSEDERRNFTRLYNKRHLTEVNELIPIIDWFKYFRSLMPLDLHNYINSDPDVILNEPEYFLRLSELIKITDTRILANYVSNRPYISLLVISRCFGALQARGLYNSMNVMRILLRLEY